MPRFDLGSRAGRSSCCYFNGKPPLESAPYLFNCFIRPGDGFAASKSESFETMFTSSGVSAQLSGASK